MLSIGTEDCKGNELTKEAFGLLKKIDTIEFRGNFVRMLGSILLLGAFKSPKIQIRKSTAARLFSECRES